MDNKLLYHRYAVEKPYSEAAYPRPPVPPRYKRR